MRTNPTLGIHRQTLVSYIKTLLKDEEYYSNKLRIKERFQRLTHKDDKTLSQLALVANEDSSTALLLESDKLNPQKLKLEQEKTIFNDFTRRSNRPVSGYSSKIRMKAADEPIKIQQPDKAKSKPFKLNITTHLNMNKKHNISTEEAFVKSQPSIMEATSNLDGVNVRFSVLSKIASHQRAGSLDYMNGLENH